jgi:hypothetical protein
MGGIPSRLPLPPGAEAPGSYKAYNEDIHKYRSDAFPATSQRNLLVLGYSQARDFINMMQASNKFSDYALVYRYDLDICNLDHLDAADMKLVQAATLIVDVYDTPRPNPDHVISCDGHVLAEQADLKCKLVFVGPRDFGVNINPWSRIPLDQRARARVQVSQHTLNWEVYFRNRTPASLYVSELDHLTPDGHTMPIFDEHGLILAEDRLHLTRAGARYVGQRVFADPIWAAVERTALARGAVRPLNLSGPIVLQRQQLVADGLESGSSRQTPHRTVRQGVSPSRRSPVEAG